MIVVFWFVSLSWNEIFAQLLHRAFMYFRERCAPGGGRIFITFSVTRPLQLDCNHTTYGQMWVDHYDFIKSCDFVGVCEWIWKIFIKLKVSVTVHREQIVK